VVRKNRGDAPHGATLQDLHNKWKEETLSILKDLEYEGDSTLAVKLIKILLEHTGEEQEPGYGFSEG